jgi:hypothetical protein
MYITGRSQLNIGAPKGKSRSASTDRPGQRRIVYLFLTPRILRPVKLGKISCCYSLPSGRLEGYLWVMLKKRQ